MLSKILIMAAVIFSTLFGAQSSFASDENTLVIIAHPDNAINVLDKKSVSSLYLGRNLENIDQQIKLYEYSNNQQIKQQFMNSLNGMSLPRYNAYWARLKFSGRQLPPHTISNPDEMLKSIAANSNAIGYLPKKYVNSSVRVILELK